MRPDFSQRVTRAVEAVEKESSAEVVVVVAPRSGSYADVDLLWGGLLGLLALAVILYGPWQFRPEPILLDVLLFALLGWWASRRSPALRRLLTSQARRLRQVEEAARNQFVLAGVSATRERTGLLIYLSLLEREGCLMTDHGIDGRVPQATFGELRQRLRAARRVLELEDALHHGLELLARRLPEHLPCTEDNPDEIPNAPRMLA